MLEKSKASLVQICSLCYENGADHLQLSEEIFQCFDQDDMLIYKYCKDRVSCDRKKIWIRQVFFVILEIKHRIETGR